MFIRGYVKVVCMSVYRSNNNNTHPWRTCRVLDGIFISVVDKNKTVETTMRPGRRLIVEEEEDVVVLCCGGGQYGWSPWSLGICYLLIYSEIHSWKKKWLRTDRRTDPLNIEMRGRRTNPLNIEMRGRIQKRVTGRPFNFKLKQHWMAFFRLTVISSQDFISQGSWHRFWRWSTWRKWMRAHIFARLPMEWNPSPNPR